MKISLKTISDLNQQYGKTDDITSKGIDQLVGQISAQLGAVETVSQLGSKYQGIIIAKVVACEKHPNADKLSVCKIDDGGVVKDVERDANQLVQVVCGAPNVQEGQTVAWLPPGVVVPDTIDHDRLVLESRDIRGQNSNGMLASLKELALGDDHSGILVIDGDYPPGTDFARAFGLTADVVLDIENKMFTHRPDCFGFLGVARELAGIQQRPFKSPDWYTSNPQFPVVEAAELKLTVTNELPELVPRFTAIVMSNVQVGPSPTWLRVELAKFGQKSINNIVDYTNWLMLETGQPVHAYDYDKVKALSTGEPVRLVVRNPHAGEKLRLLNGKEIEARPEAIMIATDKQLIGLGGVMGGSDTEVDQTTKNIILESANFDMYSIRRTSMTHGLFTDAVTRFTKGQSPLQNLAVLGRLVNQIGDQAGGQVASPVVDNNQLNKDMLTRNSVHPPVQVAADFINQRLGLKLTVDDMKKLLENVEFTVELNADKLTVIAPFWRTDIELREDLVEEIGRLYGYDHLPLVLPKHDLSPAPKDHLLSTKALIRERLAKAGANEVLTYSFVHGDLLQKTNQDKTKAFQVANALSPQLQYYRLSLMPSLLEKVHPNIKAGYDQFALFEIGKTHSLDQGEDEDGLPKEFEFTALVVTAADKLKKSGSAYYEARKYLESLVGHGSLKLQPVSQAMQGYPVVQPYELKRAAQVSLNSGEFLGIIGEFKPGVSRALKLPKYTAGFEIDTTVLIAKLAAGPSYRPLFRFPSIKQDLTLNVPADLTYSEVYDFVKTAIDSSAPAQTHSQLEPVAIYQSDSDREHKSISLRLTITGYNRTLTDTEVSHLLDSVSEAAKIKLNTK